MSQRPDTPVPPPADARLRAVLSAGRDERAKRDAAARWRETSLLVRSLAALKAADKQKDMKTLHEDCAACKSKRPCATCEEGA